MLIVLIKELSMLGLKRGLKNSDDASTKDGALWDVLFRLWAISYFHEFHESKTEQAWLNLLKEKNKQNKTELRIYLLEKMSFYSYNIFNSKKEWDKLCLKSH